MKTSLADHVRQLIDERARWLSPRPTDLPEFAARLYDGEMVKKRVHAAASVTAELREAYDLLREALG